MNELELSKRLLGYDDAIRSLSGQVTVCLLHHSMPMLSMMPGTSKEPSEYVLNNI